MANAGRVAIVPKGDYSSSVTYKRLDLVRYNNKAYVAKKASTGVVPTNTDYWMLLTDDGITIDSALSDISTNPVQNKVIKTAIDNIQTTSRATLSSAGWYRVAEINNYDTVQKCTLKILRPYDNSQAEIHTLNYEKAQNDKGTNIDIKSSGSKAGTHLFTKARITRDSSKTYFEVYYSSSIRNLNCFFTAIDGGYINTWQAITPTLTSETVDGVTVTTTYDIPANASPVTTVDDTNMTGWIALTSGFDLNNAYGKYRTVTTSIVTSLLNLPPEVTGGEVTVEWFSSNATAPQSYGVQLLRNTNDKKVNLYIRCKTDGWSGWDCIATTADLANYWSLDSKNLYIGTSSDSSGHQVMLRNSSRRISHEIDSSGNYYLADVTNSKNIIASKADGTNTFNGTASGNLPLNALSFSTTAPSNTSALWVDTANKVIKAYIDGAWTQVS